jgi:hypothetical protein
MPETDDHHGHNSRDDRRRGARDERRIEVVGALVDGGIGGIQVGGNLQVTSTASTSAEALTERDRQLVQAVLDAARQAGPAMPPQLVSAVHHLDEATATVPARRSQVRTALEQVALHASTAGAILTAAQLALDALT